MPNPKTDYHIYSHSNPVIQTMGDFVAELESLGVGFNIPELLNYTNVDNVKNIDNLIALYSKEELIKYKSIIDKVRAYVPKQSIETTTTNDGVITTPVTIETFENATNTSSSEPTIVTRDPKKLYDTLYPVGDPLLYIINFHPSEVMERHFSKLYSKEARLLFQKFIYRIQSETEYTVLITSSKRSKEDELKNIKSGKTSKVFSHHSAGLAFDINLKHKTDGTFLVKNSTNEDWIKSGAIKIADDLRIVWGGRFTNVDHDPIHFDLQNWYKVNQTKFKEDQGITALEADQAIADLPTDNVNDPYLSLPLKIGTILNMPIAQIDRDVLSVETNQIVNTVDYESFLAKQLVDLLSDKGYVRTFVPTKTQFKGDVKEIFPFISVWLWSRALSVSDLGSSEGSVGYQHRVINITPYIQHLHTNVSENGGSFSMSVANLVGEIANQSTKGSTFLGKGWRVEQGTQKASVSTKGDYVSQGTTHYTDGNELKRSRFYFEKAIQKNDIVFIRFERLELEKERENLDELETISIDSLPNQIYDMIALVDNVSTETQHANADVTINVAGRDLVKLLIDDGVYFYPTEFTADGMFSNTGATNTRLGRFGANGQYLSRFQVANKSVGKSLEFIINNLGTIEICPTDLFTPYGNSKLNLTQPLSSENVIDKRSKAYRLTDEQSQEISRQSKSNADKKDKIIDNINTIRKQNGITVSNSSTVFDIIYNFLSSRLDLGEVELIGQTIKSWENTDNFILYVNKVPDSLMSSFLISDRIWLNERGNPVTTNRPNRAIAEIENMYLKADKVELSDASGLSIFKTIGKKDVSNIFHKNKYYSSRDQFSTIIAEIDDYMKSAFSSNDYDDAQVQNIFNVADITALKLSYASIVSTGTDITLATLSKTFDDLSIDERDVFNQICSLVINERSLNKDSNKTQLQPLAGVWQIIKLIVDDSVKNRRLFDSSIGNEIGSLLNAFRKICQDPFCEFYTDTYGDQFYFIARKKPFDKESVLSMLEGRVVYDIVRPDDTTTSIVNPQIGANRIGNMVNEKTKTNVSDSNSIVQQSIIIDIDEIDVISDSLSYHQDVYSWYRLQLANLTSGTASDMAWAYLKAVFFDEFADVYGSRPLDLTTSYIPFSPIIDKKRKISNAYFIEQGVYDLKYMVESNVYLPFARTGTMVINGDRRIKKGTFVRLKGTGEIGYVDSVDHDFSISNSSIDRTTTLKLSRILVEKYVKGVNFTTGNDKEKKQVNISYFNICDLTIDQSIFSDSNKVQSNFSKTPTAGWKVNKIVFAFFLKKLQFAKNDKEIADAGLNLFEQQE